MTNTQPTLFHDMIHPPHNRSDTSKAAAERIAPEAPTMRAKVLNCIRGAGDRGITRQEIADALPMRIQTVCGRVGELLDSGEVYEVTDKRRDGRKILKATNLGVRG